MESSFSTNHQSSGEVEENRDWKELPSDVMVTVLVKLPHTEVLRNAQFVCKPWYDTCKDPALWKKLRFTDPILRFTWLSAEVESQKMAFNAIDRSCGCLVEICFVFHGNDNLLLHMAQLSSKLRCLRIQRCHEISEKALLEAIEKLPQLQEIELTRHTVRDSTIKSIGRCCPNLVSFKLNKQITKYFIRTEEDNSAAIAIAETMSGIHHLQLIGSTMTNIGLLAILDSCSSLESLDIKGCYQLDLSGNLEKRCADIMVKDGGCPGTWIEDDSGDGNECDDTGDESEDDEYPYRYKVDRDYDYADYHDYDYADHYDIFGY